MLRDNQIVLKSLNRGAKALELATDYIRSGASAEEVAAALNVCMHALTCLGREVAAARHDEAKAKEAP